MSPGIQKPSPDRVENLGLRKTYELFFETVNIRGVSRIVKSRNKVISCFWLASVLVCSASLLWQLGFLLSNYLSYPYTTMVGEGGEKSTFPYISVCNLKLKTSSDQMSIEEHSKIVESCLPSVDYAEIERAFGIKEVEMQNIIKRQLLPSGFYSNFPINRLISSHNDRTFILSHTFEDWNFKAINVDSEFFQFWHPMYHRCLTLKISPNHSRSIRASSLVLYLNNFPEHVFTGEYDHGTSFSKATGVQILFHYPGSFPDMKTGTSIGPGTETTFTIQLQSRSRLPHPYSNINCTNKQNEGDYQYTQSLCVATCMQDFVLSKCNCLSMNYQFTSSQMEKVNGLSCGNMSQEDLGAVCSKDQKGVPKFASQLACEESVLYEEEFCSDKCLPSCHENSYHYSGKSAPWPDATQQLSFYKTHIQNKTILHSEEFREYSVLLQDKMSRNKSDIEIIKALKNLRVLEDNFIQIYVKFESEYPQLYRDVGLISPSSVISSIGGTLSLWLGITAMTLVELVEFVYSLVTSGFSRKHEETKVDTSSDQRVN